MSWFVPLAVGSICVVLAFLLLVPGQMMWPYLIVALVITGVSGLMQGSVGPMIHSMVTKLNGLAGQWLHPWAGISVMIIVSIVVIGVTALLVYHRRWDMRTFGLAALVPIAVTYVPGTAGTFLIAVIGVVPTVVTAAVKALFGVG